MINRLKEYLDRNSIKYQIISHSAAYTAQEIAALVHIPGQQMAKVVMVQVDGKIIMTVLPASHVVDLRRIKELTGAQKVELSNEAEYSGLFEDCEAGAMPPFGNLYNMNVYVSTPLTEDKDIVFNAGNHRELVKLSYSDFHNLVKPEIASFSIKDPHFEGHHT